MITATTDGERSVLLGWPSLGRSQFPDQSGQETHDTGILGVIDCEHLQRTRNISLVTQIKITLPYV